ncbi:MAG: 3'-5' exonuclease [Candidatus Brocadiae bacterium]|nr:3'-5' exonuclease [Candidatus Brocadiia bacterium]
MLESFIDLYEKKQRFVVFDVETVGNFGNPIIVEIGAVEAGKNFKENFQTFQKVLRFQPSSWDAYQRELKIHQIPTKEIESGEDRSTVLQEFFQFIEGSVLICHTNFDIRAMQKNIQQHHALSSYLGWNIWKEFIDSCKLSKLLCPCLPGYSLSKLADYFNIKNPQAHRALADAITTKKIISKLLQQYYNTPSVLPKKLLSNQN